MAGPVAGTITESYAAAAADETSVNEGDEVQIVSMNGWYGIDVEGEVKVFPPNVCKLHPRPVRQFSLVAGEEEARVVLMLMHPQA